MSKSTKDRIAITLQRFPFDGVAAFLTACGWTCAGAKIPHDADGLKAMAWAMLHETVKRQEMQERWFFKKNRTGNGQFVAYLTNHGVQFRFTVESSA